MTVERISRAVGRLVLLLLLGVLPLFNCGDDETTDTEYVIGDGDAVICEPESRSCSRNDVVKCNAPGTEWIFFKECGETRVCDQGDCIDPTPDGDPDGELEDDADENG